jgi:hypothetical protein
MTWAAAIAGSVAGTQMVVGAMASNKAAKAQKKSAQSGIDEQRRQFDTMRAGLEPYSQAGTTALAGQQNLLGLGGADAQAQSIQQLQNSPMFRQLAMQGDNAILQNASATGGLRGGNTQAALGQFRPNLLNSLIDQQYSRLGGMANMGQNSAAMTGQAGMMTGQQISGLYGQQGAATAGGIISGANSVNSGLSNLSGAFGAFMGNGGWSQFGGGGKTPPPSSGPAPAPASGPAPAFGGAQSGIDPNTYYWR